MKGGGWQVLDWSPDDKQLLVLEYVSINESYLWLFDTESGAKKEITPRPAEGAEKISYGKALFSKDSKGIFATTDRESEFQRLAYIELPSGKHSYLLPNPKWDVDDWDLSHDGNRIAYTLNEDGVSSLHMLDVSAREKALTARPLPDPEFKPALGSVVISGLKFHRDPKQYLLAFNVAGARSPSDVYTWSIADQQKPDRALDRERNRRHPRRAIRAAGIGEMEIVRRSRDLRIPLHARRRKIPRQTPAHHQHPRRAGIAIPPRFPRPEQLLPQRTRLRHPPARTCAARPATGNRSCNSTTA